MYMGKFQMSRIIDTQVIRQMRSCLARVIVTDTSSDLNILVTSLNSSKKYKHMLQDMTVSQSLRKSSPASLWNKRHKWVNGGVSQRETEIVWCVPAASAFPNTCTCRFTSVLYLQPHTWGSKRRNDVGFQKLHTGKRDRPRGHSSWKDESWANNIPFAFLNTVDLAFSWAGMIVFGQFQYVSV